MHWRDEVKTIGYTQVRGDLFHYGHLRLLQTAKSQSDYFICGVLTDKGAREWKRRKGVETVTNFMERFAVINELKCIDETIPQDNVNPVENIKSIHERFPDAKLILFHGDDWVDILGSDYVKSIGGEVIKVEYYKRLLDEQIKDRLLQHGLTKADTLDALKPLLKKSLIEKSVIFSVKDWLYNKEKILNKLKREFSGKVVIRSSALNEDTLRTSMAGYYTSVLNIPVEDTKAIINAVTQVINAYNDSDDNYEQNQILIQKQTKDVLISGVVFTRKLETNSPYYVINYDDSGSTDSVTSGKADKKVEIMRNIESKNCPKIWRTLIQVIGEIESLLPDMPLDIEFAITKRNKVVIFQVRPLAVNRLLSKKMDVNIFDVIDEMERSFETGNAYSDMAFWNPAEMIGTLPNKLDYSLYKYIITDKHWDTALSTMGYHDVNPATLMVEFGGKPYIDLKLTFNALLAGKLSKDIREKLVQFYFNKLFKHPELHDKVEFEIMHNCYYPCFKDSLKELTRNGFSQQEVNVIERVVKLHTNRIFKESMYWFAEAEHGIEELNKSRTSILKQVNYKSVDSLICGIKRLLDSCIDSGTIDFSRMARMAFIGNIWLKSMVKKGMITKEFYDSYLKSISVVKIGEHLRPGTYNITSLRYDKNPSIEKVMQIQKKTKVKIPDILKGKERFIRKSIEMRELVKFEFTKNLSDAIELIAELGKLTGFTRAEMTQLDIETIITSKGRGEKDIKELWRFIIDARKKQRTINEKLSLPPILFSKLDFEVVPTYIAKPNFITRKIIEAEIANDLKDIEHKVVVIQNADPGYDWIFSRNIKGLVTCYGGVASHMSIRCAELGIPAAIGCGTEFYKKIRDGKYMNLNCVANSIKVDGVKIV